jgi:hypothetical protein
VTGSGGASGAAVEIESAAIEGVETLEAVGGSGVLARGAGGAAGSDGSGELVTGAATLARTAEAAVLAIETACAAAAENGTAGADAAAGVV